MTAHARQAIRAAVVTALTGLSTTSTRCYASRMRPQDEAGLPCLLVTTENESVEQEVSGIQTRQIVLQIRGMAKASTSLDTTLDSMAAEIETAMNSAGTLSGKVAGMVLAAMDIDFDDTLDKPVGAIRLTYHATYFTQAGTPGTTL